MNLNEYQIVPPHTLNDLFVLASDKNGHRCVLIKSKEENVVQRFKTDNMSLKTNVDMFDENSNSAGQYHVVQCLSQDVYVNIQFTRVSMYMLSEIKSPIDSSTVMELFQDFQTLFETTADSNSHSLQIGVYGEMVLLKYLYSVGRADVAEKWHSDFYTKHDLEIDPKHKVEIKTTNKEIRIHSFRHNQLVQKNINVYIVSVMVEECEQGKALLDLMIEVQSMFSDVAKKLLVDKLIRRCNLSEENKGIVCDEQHVFDGIKIYRAEDVPHISVPIPLGVSNVSYDVCLDAEIPEISIADI